MSTKTFGTKMVYLDCPISDPLEKPEVWAWIADHASYTYAGNKDHSDEALEYFYNVSNWSFHQDSDVPEELAKIISTAEEEGVHMVLFNNSSD